MESTAWAVPNTFTSTISPRPTRGGPKRVASPMVFFKNENTGAMGGKTGTLQKRWERTRGSPLFAVIAFADSKSVPSVYFTPWETVKIGR